MSKPPTYSYAMTLRLDGQMKSDLEVGTSSEDAIAIRFGRPRCHSWEC